MSMTIRARAGLMAAGAFVTLGTPASAACSAYALPSAFSIRQSNGFAVTIRTFPGAGGEFNGSAHYHTGSDFRRVVGTIEGGDFDGRILSFRIVWSGRGSGRYEGAVDKNGKLFGTTRGGGSTASFKGLQPFKCADGSSA